MCSQIFFLGILLSFISSLEAKCDINKLNIPINGHYNTTTTIQTSGILNVHLIPHSHDDPGWRKTVDQYYYGSRIKLGSEGVQYILDNVIDQLLKNPNRKFMFVEQSFFQRWWNEQDLEMKKNVKRLVKNGQLDLTANGGWCMHDEATPSYRMMLDQTAFGHRFLREEFNITPTIGWQIDPFGHSAVQASLLSSSIGFDALYFARMDYEEYNYRTKSKELEFLWQPFSHIPPVFTGKIQNNYNSPPGFDFTFDEPIMDDKRLHDFNVCSRVDEFVEVCKKRASLQIGNNLFIPMGTDFEFKNARQWYKNMDKLIHYVNEDGRINVLYSNLSYYTKIKHNENLNWTIRSNDLFPIADDAHSFWSGFFSSRPALKRYARTVSQFYTASTFMEVLSRSNTTELNPLRAAVGVVQHHDALTGTETQAVAFDYAQRLSEGVEKAEKRLNNVIQKIAGEDNFGDYEFCWLKNISICNATSSSKNIEVALFNPSLVERKEYIDIPVSSANHPVVEDIDSVFPNFIPTSVLNSFPIRKNSKSLPYTLSFPVKLSPLEFKRIRISYEKINPEQKLMSPKKISCNVGDKETILENQYLRVVIDCQTGSLRSIVMLNGYNENTITLSTGIQYYESYQGQGQKSGAYIFRPAQNYSHALGGKVECIYSNLNSSDVQEIRFMINSWATLVYRLTPFQKHLTIQWGVLEIPIDDGIGKEVVFQLNSSITSKESMWYSDTNGYDYLERKRYYHPSWNVTESEPVAGNYYPMTEAAMIDGDNSSITLLTDRAQGVSSLSDGNLEVMIHRRLLKDDNRGVEEPLNETELVNGTRVGLFVRGTFELHLNSQRSPFNESDRLKHRFPPLIGFRPIPSKPFPQIKKNKTTLFKVDWPSTLSLDAFQVQPNGHAFIRIQNYVEEKQQIKETIRIDLRDFFPNQRIKNIHEVSLVEGPRRKTLKWKTTDSILNLYSSSKETKDTMFVKELKVKEMRAFEVELLKAPIHPVFESIAIE